MDFSEAVQWWEEWQLRILVLSSLFLQYFLFIAAALRKCRIPDWFRFFVWLAYLASDAVAIYALATLFNRHKQQEWVSMHRNSVNLEVLWAPILLLHLGGQDSITAYNIEDNELWRRHVLTALSQITVAIYVFHKSWSGEKRLLQAAILIFVPGILKCLEKPWALKSASINSIVNTSNPWVQRVFGEAGKSEITPLGEYVLAASTYVQAHVEGLLGDASANHKVKSCDASANHKVESEPYNLFVDLSYSYPDRLENLKYMVQRKTEAHGLLRSSLSKTFDRLYTKYQMDHNKVSCRTLCGQMVRSVVVCLMFAAIPLFHKSNREVYNGTDVKITYTLLCCTVALEYISTGIKVNFSWYPWLRDKMLTWYPWLRDKMLTWPDQVAQYNLIGYLSRNKKHKRLRRFASLLDCKDYLDQLWCMNGSCKSSRDITELIHDHITEGWNRHIHDTASYRKFNDSRGQCTLKQERCGNAVLELYVQRPFDESVLLWHLATDFCFHHAASTPPTNEIAHRSREISNYMAYLLFVNPDMLMTGAQSSLFRDVYVKLKKMVEEALPSSDAMGEEELAKMILQKVEGEQGSGLVHDAWKLAQKLMELSEVGNEDGTKKNMWTVIQGVWVEMLCFSAIRCGGYLHAKSLGKGGEYLSYVWLLLSYMGMESLAERMQRTHLGTLASTGEENV